MHVLDPLSHDFDDQAVHNDLILFQCQYSSTIQQQKEWNEYKAFFSMGDSPGEGISVVRSKFANFQDATDLVSDSLD